MVNWGCSAVKLNLACAIHFGDHSSPLYRIFRQKRPLAWQPGLCFHPGYSEKDLCDLKQFNNRFAASAAVQSKTGNFDLQDTVRGAPTMGVPETVPVRASP